MSFFLVNPAPEVQGKLREQEDAQTCRGCQESLRQLQPQKPRRSDGIPPGRALRPGLGEHAVSLAMLGHGEDAAPPDHGLLLWPVTGRDHLYPHVWGGVKDAY